MNWLTNESVLFPVATLAVFVTVGGFVAASAFLEIRQLRVTMVTILDFSSQELY